MVLVPDTHELEGHFTRDAYGILKGKDESMVACSSPVQLRPGRPRWHEPRIRYSSAPVRRMPSKEEAIAHALEKMETQRRTMGYLHLFRVIQEVHIEN
jgi:hypothetical protein